MDHKIGVLLGYAVVVCCLQSNAAAQNFEVELNSFKPLAEYDTSWVDWDTLRLKKISRTEFGLSGSYILHRNLGNEQRVSVQVFKFDRDANRRGSILYQIDKPLCMLLEENKGTYDSMVESSNLPENNPCPFPKNTYTFNDYVLVTDFVPKETPLGDYIIVMTLKDAEKGVGGCEVDLTIS